MFLVIIRLILQITYGWDLHNSHNLLTYKYNIKVFTKICWYDKSDNLIKTN